MTEIKQHKTLWEVAEMIGVSKRTLTRYIERGYIEPPIKYGHKTRRYSPEMVERILDGNTETENR